MCADLTWLRPNKKEKDDTTLETYTPRKNSRGRNSLPSNYIHPEQCDILIVFKGLVWFLATLQSHYRGRLTVTPICVCRGGAGAVKHHVAGLQRLQGGEGACGTRASRLMQPQPRAAGGPTAADSPPFQKPQPSPPPPSLPPPPQCWS